MHGLAAVEAVEEQAVRAFDPRDGWYLRRSPWFGLLSPREGIVPESRGPRFLERSAGDLSSHGTGAANSRVQNAHSHNCEGFRLRAALRPPSVLTRILSCLVHEHEPRQAPEFGNTLIRYTT